MESSGAEVTKALLEASSFLRYGPIGLAGLMLVLVVVTLVIGSLTPSKERILKRFMYVGAFCFVVAAIMAFLPSYITASHMLYLRLEPLDMNTTHKFPPPTVTIDAVVQPNPLQYRIASDVTAIVDVSQAINFVEEYATVNAKQQTAINDVAALVQKVQADLAKQNILAVNDSCSGGPHGIPTNHSAEITALNTSLSADVAGIGGIVSSAAKINPPSPSDSH